MYSYLQKARDADRQISFNFDASNQKVLSAYQVLSSGLISFVQSDPAVPFSSFHDPFVLALQQECITFQHQLNVVRSVMARLEVACNPGSNLILDPNYHQYFVKASTDKLRVLGEGLLDVLLHLGSLPMVSNLQCGGVVHSSYDGLCFLHLIKFQHTSNFILFSCLSIHFHPLS